MTQVKNPAILNRFERLLSRFHPLFMWVIFGALLALGSHFAIPIVDPGAPWYLKYLFGFIMGAFAANVTAACRDMARGLYPRNYFGGYIPFP